MVGVRISSLSYIPKPVAGDHDSFTPSVSHTDDDLEDPGLSVLVRIFSEHEGHHLCMQVLAYKDRQLICFVGVRNLQY